MPKVPVSGEAGQNSEPAAVTGRRNGRSFRSLDSDAPCGDAFGKGEKLILTAQMPYAPPGLTIGLLGGSFDPAHAGHVHITLWALKAFGLSRVWWMMSPGNPLKPDAPATLSRRLDAARSVMCHPRVLVTDVESRLGTRRTADTLRQLKMRYPGVRFVWLMGADNLRSFHRWDRWDSIMREVPVGVLARPGDQIGAGLSPAAARFARYRLDPLQARALPLLDPPCWTMLSGRMLELSSSELRAQGMWNR